ncbi:HIT domain-containing protein [Candidatus Woesearchaeota archaeon]|nr:HIT domain-containing protein [Candidatus Woesearchaeota archaeon]
MPGEEDFDSMSPEEMAEYQKQNCIFCKIIKGDIPSRKVYEDDKIVALLDINPAAKGHTLIMTKEHYPILPVIPFDTAAHMYRITKGLSKAIKSGMVVGKSTIFIANGAIAGQQSPHFLYHIIPREDNDGLDNFNIIQKDYMEEEVQQFLPQLKGKIGLMMRQYFAKKGGAMPGVPQPVAPGAEPLPLSQQDLAKLIESNPQIKSMIINDPEGFKKEIEANPDLKKLFVNININKLSDALKQIGKQ